MMTQGGAEDQRRRLPAPVRRRDLGQRGVRLDELLQLRRSRCRPATSNGELWIYDPVFCATNTNGQYGTGDRYLGGVELTGGLRLLRPVRHQEHALRPERRHARGRLRLGLRAVPRPHRSSNLGGPSAGGCGRRLHDDRQLQRRRQGRLLPRQVVPTGIRPSRREDVPPPHHLRGSVGRERACATRTPTTRSPSGRRRPAARPRIYGIGAMEVYTPPRCGRPGRRSTWPRSMR